MSNDDKGNYMLGVIMAHYSLKLGLKKIFIKEVKDVTDELSQLHYMKNFFPVDPRRSSDLIQSVQGHLYGLD